MELTFENYQKIREQNTIMQQEYKQAIEELESRFKNNKREIDSFFHNLKVLCFDQLIWEYKNGISKIDPKEIWEIEYKFHDDKVEVLFEEDKDYGRHQIYISLKDLLNPDYRIQQLQEKETKQYIKEQQKIKREKEEYERLKQKYGDK